MFKSAPVTNSTKRPTQDCSWTVSGLYLDYIWTISVFYLDYIWTVYGLYLDCI
jgi:hypothetical protein